MAIEMGKKYRTRDGRDVRILCTDAPGDYPVRGCLLPSGLHGEWTLDGLIRVGQSWEDASDLIEISPYSDIAIDAPGWARDKDFEDWQESHFAGVEDGLPMTWRNGRTSHTTQDKTSWDEFTTTKPESA